MISTSLWGEVPAGFKRLSPNPKQIALVREGLESRLDPARFFAGEQIGAGDSPFRGRERLCLLHLGSGETALVRRYRHGGLFRKFTGDIFFTWPPRPFRELAVTLEARRRGVPTVEALGAWVERVGGPFYRGWFITGELKGALDLWDALRGELFSASERKILLEAAARSVRRMHQKGVYHEDLNLKNIVVRREDDRIVGYIIDLDKAKLFSGEISAGRSGRNLGRLLRSVRKLDPEGRRFSPQAWDLFLRSYREAATE